MTQVTIYKQPKLSSTVSPGDLLHAMPTAEIYRKAVSICTTRMLPEIAAKFHNRNVPVIGLVTSKYATLETLEETIRRQEVFVISPEVHDHVWRLGFNAGHFADPATSAFLVIGRVRGTKHANKNFREPGEGEHRYISERAGEYVARATAYKLVFSTPDGKEYPLDEVLGRLRRK